MIKEKTENYQLHKHGDAMYLTFPKLDAYDGLTHLFTTRFGGVSEGECESWNFGNHEADSSENIYENFRILAEILDVPIDAITLSCQTHSSNIITVSGQHKGMGVTRDRDYRDVDGLITTERNIPIMTLHADCNSVFLYDPIVGAIGLAHSGWKGTLGHICTKTVTAMKESFGCNPENILAGQGPALCQDCFEVEDDVASLFFQESCGRIGSRYDKFSYRKGVKTYIDLKEIVRLDLIEAGVKADNIFNMELCTKCHNDIFFSHRGQGQDRGLMAAVLMLK